MKKVLQNVAKKIKESETKLGKELAKRISEELKKTDTLNRVIDLSARFSLSENQAESFVLLWLSEASNASLLDLKDFLDLDENDLADLEEKDLVEHNGIYGVAIKRSVVDFVLNKSRIDINLRWFLTKEAIQSSYNLWQLQSKGIAKGLLSTPKALIEVNGLDYTEACAMFAQASEELKKPLFSIDLKALENARYTPDFHKVCGQAVAHIALWDGLVILEAHEESMLRTVLRSFSAKQVPMVVFSETRTNYLQNVYSLNLEECTSFEPGKFWHAESKELGIDVEASTIEQLESVFALGRVATKNALVEYKLLDQSKASFENLAAICRKYTSQALNEYAKKIQPRYTWDDIILPPVTKYKLREVSNYVSSLSRIEKDWSFRKRHSRGHGVTVLLKGHSGTGKTMAAEVLAKSLGMDLYQVDLASVTSKYVGETQKNLSKIFAAAKESAGVLFFDEGEMLFSKRSDVESSNDKYANLEVNYLLQEIEAYEGVVIISTNHSQMIDPAFLRRIMFDIEFPRPSAETRRIIWEKHLSGGVPLDKDVDLDFLSKLPLSGGIIYNIVKRAAGLASSQQGNDRKVKMKDILLGVQREYQKAEMPIEREVFGNYWRHVSPEWETVNVTRKSRSNLQILAAEDRQ